MERTSLARKIRKRMTARSRSDINILVFRPYACLFSFSLEVEVEVRPNAKI